MSARNAEALNAFCLKVLISEVGPQFSTRICTHPRTIDPIRMVFERLHRCSHDRVAVIAAARFIPVPLATYLENALEICDGGGLRGQCICLCDRGQ